MVHAQDSSRDDLGERVFNFCAADTIPDWANGGVARVCHMGAKLKTLNDAVLGRTLYFTAQTNRSVPEAYSFLVIYLNIC